MTRKMTPLGLDPKIMLRHSIPDHDPWPRRYLSAVEIVENVGFSLVPIPVMTGMMAKAMPVAIRPYSIAVAALSSLRNLTIRCIGRPLGILLIFKNRIFRA